MFVQWGTIEAQFPARQPQSPRSKKIVNYEIDTGSQWHNKSSMFSEAARVHLSISMQLVIRICCIKSRSILYIQTLSPGPRVNLYIVEVWVLFVGYKTINT